ncbi:hypothetical protein Q9966_009582 [Columba livia]|nr:hypothetical protein Q9966_009582 [Columba livia]
MDVKLDDLPLLMIQPFQDTGSLELEEKEKESLNPDALKMRASGEEELDSERTGTLEQLFNFCKSQFSGSALPRAACCHQTGSSKASVDSDLTDEEHLYALGDGKWCFAHCNLNYPPMRRLGQQGAAVPWDLAQNGNSCSPKAGTSEKWRLLEACALCRHRPTHWYSPGECEVMGDPDTYEMSDFMELHECCLVSPAGSVNLGAALSRDDYLSAGAFPLWERQECFATWTKCED